VVPGCAPGPPRGLPRSNGEGEVPAGGPGGTAVAPGRGGPPGLPLPRSNGEGETPAGAAVAPGGTRPGLPRGPGDTGDWAPPTAGLPPTAGDSPPPGRAAARVGGGIFFGFSVLIFCSNFALSGTPFQPCSSFGFATVAFTAGGFAVGALVSFCGAATTSLSPCTLVSPPDLAAPGKSAAVCRSIVSR